MSPLLRRRRSCPAESVRINGGGELVALRFELGLLRFDKFGALLEVGLFGLAFGGDLFKLNLLSFEGGLKFVEVLHQVEFDVFNVTDVVFGFGDFFVERLILGVGLDLIELRRYFRICWRLESASTSSFLRSTSMRLSSVLALSSLADSSATRCCAAAISVGIRVASDFSWASRPVAVLDDEEFFEDFQHDDLSPRSVTTRRACVNAAAHPRRARRTWRECRLRDLLFARRVESADW